MHCPNCEYKVSYWRYWTITDPKDYSCPSCNSSLKIKFRNIFTKGFTYLISIFIWLALIGGEIFFLSQKMYDAAGVFFLMWAVFLMWGSYIAWRIFKLEANYEFKLRKEGAIHKVDFKDPIQEEMERFEEMDDVLADVASHYGFEVKSEQEVSKNVKVLTFTRGDFEIQALIERSDGIKPNYRCGMKLVHFNRGKTETYLKEEIFVAKNIIKEGFVKAFSEKKKYEEVFSFFLGDTIIKLEKMFKIVSHRNFRPRHLNILEQILYPAIYITLKFLIYIFIFALFGAFGGFF